MTISPLQAASTDNDAIAGDSNHRTRRFIDGKVISAVVAIVPDVGLVDSLLRHFFVISAKKQLYPVPRLPASLQAILPRIIVGRRAIGCN